MKLSQLFVMRGEKSSLTSYDYRSWQARIPSKSGKFVLSIVAGPHQYCSPREFKDNAEYESVELAIFTENGQWATKEEASPVFPIIGMGEYDYDGTVNSAVFGGVPVDDIWKVVEVL